MLVLIDANILIPLKNCALFKNADGEDNSLWNNKSHWKKSFLSEGLIWYDSTRDAYVRVVCTAQRKCTEHCRIKGGGFIYEDASFHLLMLWQRTCTGHCRIYIKEVLSEDASFNLPMLHPFAHLWTFIYACWTEVNWQMSIAIYGDLLYWKILTGYFNNYILFITLLSTSGNWRKKYWFTWPNLPILF